MVNYYDILGISASASADEIKAAFKKLAVQFHPDKNPDDLEKEERFKEINHAHQVLSNPYQKARYDLMRSYGTASSDSETYTTPSYPPPKPHYRRRYAPPPIDYQENWKATLYAFVFTFAVALVVMAVIGLKHWYDHVKEESRLAHRRTTYEHARTLYATGDLDSTYYVISSLGGIDPKNEEDMLLFRNGLIEETKYLGEVNYVAGNFEEAIYYLHILDKYTVIKELSLKEALAKAYRHTHQTEAAIYTLTQLMMSGYRTISTYVLLAEIYRDDMQDYEQSKQYFESANKAARKFYEEAYGKAYPVILSGYILPELHYRLYTGLADIYLKLDEPEMAIDITRWNQQVWPNREDNFLIAAESYRRLGDETHALEELDKLGSPIN